MTAKDHQKLLDSGFTIIREESRHISGFNFDMRIKAKTMKLFLLCDAEVREMNGVGK